MRDIGGIGCGDSYRIIQTLGSGQQGRWWGLFVCLLLSVPATCECISRTDLLRQFYVLPH